MLGINKLEVGGERVIDLEYSTVELKRKGLSEEFSFNGRQKCSYVFGRN